MNVNSLFLTFLLIPFCWFSQEKTDVYFILNENPTEYVFQTEGGQLDNYKDLLEISRFNFYDKAEYKKRQEINRLEKKELGYNTLKWEVIPKTIFFNVIEKSKQEIKNCELHDLDVVDFEWLRKNSWKENNPNILFKDLYFLYRIDNNQYIKYEVGRTVIAY